MKLSGFAHIGGVSVKEMAALEREFIMDLNYSIYVGEELFANYQQALVQKLPNS